MKALSKSDYVLGLECPGHLWMKYHDKENIPPHPAGVLKRFEQGKIVGKLAKKLFPEGIDIPDKDYLENIKKSKELLQKRKILFEAAVTTDHLYGRADILVPAGKDEWDIIEVKSSSKVDKNKHYHDLSFQRYVYEKAGLKIRKCFLMHLNKEYVRNGEVDVKKLFVQEDLTSEIDKVMAEVPKNIKFLLEIVNSKRFPN
ncbi:Dna2/Cas4 domain-containing protein, partial [Candidatus Woesearchaeota archaeon]|nr:Dna2/Cas4 domain-containing protein [Candidatus Woesearchaeota archaeon]